MAMECLDGEELSAVVPHQFPLKQRRICDISLQIARALEASHKAGLIHQDLKPANIMLINEDGHEVVKLLDFGIARMAGDKDVPNLDENALGTPAFMSPEQVAKLGGITASTDLFSLGGVMYYMLTCRLPFAGTEVVDMATSILTEDPIPPNQARLDTYVDPTLEAICLRALQKNPENRYGSASEMVQILEHALSVIPEVNPKKKHKIVVGTPTGEDLSGETRFNVAAFTESSEESGEMEDGGTLINLSAMPDDRTQIGRAISDDDEREPKSNWRIFYIVLVLGLIAIAAGVGVYFFYPFTGKEPDHNDFDDITVNNVRPKQTEMRLDALENVVISANYSAKIGCSMGIRDIETEDEVEEQAETKTENVDENEAENEAENETGNEAEKQPETVGHLKHSQIKAKLTEASRLEKKKKTKEACEIYQYLLNVPNLNAHQRKHVVNGEKRVCNE